MKRELYPNPSGGRYYLMCERDWIYHLLILAAGFFGAYTYLLRGNVFCCSVLF